MATSMTVRKNATAPVYEISGALDNESQAP
jgi:hypothetical protein